MLPLCGSKLQLRFPVARDHAVTHTFSYLSMPLQATNWLPIICGWLRRAFFKACPPAVCTIARPDLPARLGPPVDLPSTSIRGRGFAAYLPGCARQLFNVRCAHYARGALLTNQSSPVPAAARPPGGALACALGRGTLPPAARPPGGALACAPGSGTLPLTPRNLVPADVQLLFFGCPPPGNAGKSIQRFHAPSVPR